ncbi:hypothetical protein CLV24_108180 [Pontibacter ummariensis]|uniref:Uncharacterized protein n=1 Tax=Pontibacter ummariensis TaxID=1610492 RepID=A0A239F6J2_9BACT|nr:hypothetical protein [Pontibacter ummariensis]PRY12436.1 hypothetical protein CLV24_108180 [Pontibacter ummariensis]SNS51714.1 hypothetical protein SAMN06296052_1085 [Pontibacter ummariensis]
MAEINVEKKNKNPIWPWILGILIIGGVVWWVLAEDEKPLTAYDAPEAGQFEEGVASGGYAAAETEEVNTAAVVRDYVEFVEERFEGADFNLNHSYTSEGILKLQNALAVLAREKTDLGTEIRDEMEALEAYAQEIQTNPDELRHAELMQLAFVRAVNIMQRIQEEGDAVYVNKVMEEADDINGEVPALEQKPAIKEFFVAASEAVERMSEDVGS